jgi:hypothetical protein
VLCASQINTCSDVALTYNDASVLENHHAAVMFRTLRRPGMNPVPLLSPEEFRRFRKLCLVSILATDMTEHAALTTTIQSLPTKVADAWPSTEVRTHRVVPCGGGGGGGGGVVAVASGAVTEVWR